MSKKLAKYEIESLAQMINSQVKAANKAKYQSEADSVQAEMDNFLKLSVGPVRRMSEDLKTLKELEVQVRDFVSKMDNDKFTTYVNGLNINTYGKSPEVTFATPQVQVRDVQMYSEILQSVVIETMKKDFDVEALVSALVEKYS